MKQLLSEEELLYQLQQLAPANLNQLTLRLVIGLLNPACYHILLRTTDKSEVMANAHTIIYCLACGNFVQVFVREGNTTATYTVNKTLGQMARELARFGMAKLGRRYIVNPAFVEKNFPTEHRLILKGGIVINMPRRVNFDAQKNGGQLGLY